MMHSRLSHHQIPSLDPLFDQDQNSLNVFQHPKASSVVKKSVGGGSSTTATATATATIGGVVGDMKTPPLKAKKTSSASSVPSRRAFGDISNKKIQHRDSDRAGKYNGARKLHNTTRRTLHHQEQQQQQQPKLSAKNTRKTLPALKPADDAPDSITRHSQKQVNFVLPAAPGTNAHSAPAVATTKVGPLLLLDDLAIEMPAGRTYSEQVSWDDDSFEVPQRPDLQQIMLDKRVQASIERQAQIERDGEELLLQQIQNMLRQDDLDLKRFDREMVAAATASLDDDSLDLAAGLFHHDSDQDLDLINVSF